MYCRKAWRRTSNTNSESAPTASRSRTSIVNCSLSGKTKLAKHLYLLKRSDRIRTGDYALLANKDTGAGTRIPYSKRHLSGRSGRPRVEVQTPTGALTVTDG